MKTASQTPFALADGLPRRSEGKQGHGRGRKHPHGARLRRFPAQQDQKHQEHHERLDKPRKGRASLSSLQYKVACELQALEVADQHLYRYGPRSLRRQ